MKNIKTFEAFGTNYTVENWTDFISYYIQTNISPKLLINKNFSITLPIKNFQNEIERYFTKKSFYTFPIKYIRLTFDVATYQNSNKITRGGYSSYENNIELFKFDFFNINSEFPTFKKLDINLHIKTTSLNWEANENNSVNFWEEYKDLNSILQHEIHHAFEEYQMSLNNVNISKTKDSSLDIIIRNIWDEIDGTQLITKFIYLSTSHEINARVTQIYREIKNKDIKTKEDFLKELKNSPTWKDYLVLKNYEADDYIKAFKHSFNKEEENKFLKLWNDKASEIRFPKFKNIETFFEYWKPICKSKSEYMKNKFLKIWNLINQNY